MNEPNRAVLDELLKAKIDATFARKVMDILVERHPEDTMPWEWDVNDMLQYNHFETEFESGIKAYCSVLRILKVIAKGEPTEEIEKILKEASEEGANHMLIAYGWIKKGEQA